MNFVSLFYAVICKSVTHVLILFFYLCIDTIPYHTISNPFYLNVNWFKNKDQLRQGTAFVAELLRRSRPSLIKINDFRFKKWMDCSPTLRNCQLMVKVWINLFMIRNIPIAKIYADSFIIRGHLPQHFTVRTQYIRVILNVKREICAFL